MLPVLHLTWQKLAFNADKQARRALTQALDAALLVSVIQLSYISQVPLCYPRLDHDQTSIIIPECVKGHPVH